MSLHSAYIAQILRLGTGTGLAFGITLAATPFLTRLYGPAAYGEFAIIMAVLSITVVASGLKFETAIPLPEEAEEVRALVVLAGIALLLVGLGMLGLLHVSRVNGWLPPLAQLEFLVYLLPLTIMLKGIQQIVEFVLLRDSHSTRLAICRVGQAAMAVCAQLSLGLVGLLTGFVLAFGQTIGVLTAICLALCSKDYSINRFNIPSPATLLATIKKFDRFPKLALPAGVMNVASYEIPALIMAMYFSAEVIGEVSVALRIVMLPTVLVSASLSQVFYNQASLDTRSSGTAHDVTIVSVRALAMIAIPVYSVLAVCAPWLAEPLLGTGWADTGLYVSCLAPMCLVMMCVAPVSQLFFVHQRQKSHMFFQVAALAISVLAFIAAGYLDSPMIGILIFSVLSFIRFLVMLRMILRIERISLREILGIPVR